MGNAIKFFLFFSLIGSCFFLFGENTNFNKSPLPRIYDRYSAMSNEDMMDIALRADSIGKKDKAMTLYTMILGRYQSDMAEKDKKLCAKAANAIGIIYLDLYRYSQSLKMYLLSLRICDEIGDEYYKSFLHNNIGVLYAGCKDYPMAMEYWEKSYNYHISNQAYTDAGDVLCNLIFLSINTADTLALNKYLKYAEREENSKIESLIFARFSAKSFLAIRRGETIKAIQYANKAVEFLQNCQRDDLYCAKMQCISYHYLGIAYRYNKVFDSAVAYINKSTEIAIHYGFKDIESNNYKELAGMYKDRRDYQRYAEYLELFTSKSDTVSNIIDYGNMKDVFYGDRLEETQNEIYRLQDQQKANNHIIRLQRIILFGSFAALLVISFFVILIWIQKKKLAQSYQDLFFKNREILAKESFQNGKENIRYGSSSMNDAYKNSLIFSIQEYMKMKTVFIDPDLTLESFSKLLNSNTKYVSQVINEHFDKNFTSFVNEYRVKEACKLFENPESMQYTIEAIAQKVGFRNRTTFSPIFKKYTGITPSQYLKMCMDS